MKSSSEKQIELSRALRVLMLQLRQSMDNVLLPIGITSSQYTALSVLSEQQQASGAEIARKCRMTPQAAHKLISAIESNGWLKREYQPANKKTFLLRLTPPGERTLAKARPERLVVLQKMLKGFSSEELKGLGDFLNRCIDNLEIIK